MWYEQDSFKKEVLIMNSPVNNDDDAGLKTSLWNITCLHKLH